MSSADDWNEHYATGFLPWDTGAPDEQLVAMVERGVLPRGRALDIGCGTGTNVAWLAQRGWEVVGVDVAPLAIEAARKKAPKGVTLAVYDFLAQDPPRAPYDLVFDRGCFHCFEEEDRARFAARVAALLTPTGQWLSLVGSTEGPPRDTGPPRRSARDVLHAIEPALELVELQSFFFDTNLPHRSAAWAVRARRREVPAQPSSRH